MFGNWKCLSTGDIVREFIASNGVKLQQKIATAAKSTYFNGRYIKTPREQVRKHALLIAAAPDLLAFAHQVHQVVIKEHLVRTKPSTCIACQVILKAEGGSDVR